MFACTNVCFVCVCSRLTLDGPLEERLAGLAGRHAIVVAWGHVTTHQTQPLGHRAQHELTLNWAFFFTKPPVRRRENQRTRSDSNSISFPPHSPGQHAHRPVRYDIVGQPRCMTVEAWRVQSIAVIEAFDRGPVAGVGVRGRASRAWLCRADVALRAGAGAGGLTLYSGGTAGVQAPHWHPAEMSGEKKSPKGKWGENVPNLIERAPYCNTYSWRREVWLSGQLYIRSHLGVVININDW